MRYKCIMIVNKCDTRRAGFCESIDPDSLQKRDIKKQYCFLFYFPSFAFWGAYFLCKILHLSSSKGIKQARSLMRLMVLAVNVVLLFIFTYLSIYFSFACYQWVLMNADLISLPLASLSPHSKGG